MRDFSFAIESEVHTNRQTLWQHVTQMKNVNAGLMLFAKLTYQALMAEIGNKEVPLGRYFLKVLFWFVNDELHFAPRISVLGFLLLPVYKTTFKSRHKHLQQFFG